LRARRSSKSEGGLQATADAPGRSPLRMLLSFVLTRVGGRRTRPTLPPVQTVDRGRAITRRAGRRIAGTRSLPPL